MTKKYTTTLAVLILIAVFISGCVSNEAPTASTAGGGAGETQAGEAKISIKHHATTQQAVSQYVAAEMDKMYLIIDMTIENQGYQSFSTNPYNFGVVVNNVKYTHDFATYSLDNKLESTELQDGGKTSGKIAFKIPKQSGNVDYAISYEGFSKYNIVYEVI